jgi:hypothetical protein
MHESSFAAGHPQPRVHTIPMCVWIKWSASSKVATLHLNV